MHLTEAMRGWPVTLTLPWGTLSMMGFQGWSDAERPRVLVSVEWPVRLGEGIDHSKDDVEMLHLEAYRSRVLETTGRLPITDVRRGDDPPDFVATRGAKEVRVDCTQLTVPRRRQANALFESLRRALLAQPRERFQRLAGCNVTVDFTSDERTAHEMPHSPGEQEAIDALIDALAELRPNLREDRAEGPRVVAAENFGETGFGAAFRVGRMAGARPLTEFYTRLGFEIALGFTTEHDIEDAWSELERVVAKHDKGQADELIVSTSGPDRHGAMHLSEALFAALLSAPEVVDRRGVPVRNLKRVTLHVWQTGLVRTLAPIVRDEAPEFFGPVLAPHLRPADATLERRIIYKRMGWSPAAI